MAKSKTSNFLFKNRHALFFAIIFFVLFPFLYSTLTIDPELHLRFLAASLLILLVFLYFLFIGEKTFIHELFQPDKIAICFTGLFLVSVVSIYKSINPGDAWQEANKLFILLICFFLLVYSFKKSENAILIYSACINIGVIIFSVYGFSPFFPAIFDSLSKNEPVRLNYILVSVFANKNFYAETVFLSLPFSLYGSLFLNRGMRLLSVFSLILAIISVVILVSAAVWIAFFVFVFSCLITFFILKSKKGITGFSKKSKIIVPGILLICAAVLCLSLFLNPVQKMVLKPARQKMEAIKYYLNNDKAIFSNTQANSNSLFERLLMIRNSVKMFKESPFTGSGLANWKILFAKYGVTGTGFLNTGKVRFEHPHNDYLFVLCEAGIIGLILWMGIFFFGIKQALHFIAQTEINHKRWFMVLILAGTLGFMTISLFSYPKERFYSMIFLLTMLAYPASLYPVKRKIQNPQGKFTLIILSILCLTSVMICWKRYTGELFMYRAKTAQAKQNLPEMQKYISKAQSYFFPIDITSTPLTWYLGLTSYYRGDTANAFNFYSIAHRQNPYHLQVLNDLGTLYEKKGERKEAIDLFNSALTISPLNDRTLLNLTSAYFNEGRTDDAIAVLKTYPDTSYIEYKNSLKILLLSNANEYVQANKDSVLANYLSAQLSENENYLVQLFQSSADHKIPYKMLSNKLKNGYFEKK